MPCHYRLSCPPTTIVLLTLLWLALQLAASMDVLATGWRDEAFVSFGVLAAVAIASRCRPVASASAFPVR